MYARPDYLVNTEWLAEHLDDSNVRVFDVTGMLTATFTNLAEERSYSAGHIPGAAFLDIAGRDQRLSKRGAPLPWSWPTRDIAEEDLGAIGIDNDSRVCLLYTSPSPRDDR